MHLLRRTSPLLRLFTIVLLTLLPRMGAAQSETEEMLPPVKPGEVGPALAVEVQVGQALYQGDSIPHIIMPTLYKYPKMEFRNEGERTRYLRLVANVKKILPLAKMVKITIIETHDYLATLPDKKARQAHINAMEEGLRRDYTPMLKKMSRSQGRLLVKLIDRECNMTGYNIAKAFIGAFKANIYQGVAFLFGQSLTKHYDPEGDDRYTERVVRMVESGQL